MGIDQMTIKRSFTSDEALAAATELGIDGARSERAEVARPPSRRHASHVDGDDSVPSRDRARHAAARIIKEDRR